MTLEQITCTSTVSKGLNADGHIMLMIVLKIWLNIQYYVCKTTGLTGEFQGEDCAPGMTSPAAGWCLGRAPCDTIHESSSHAWVNTLDLKKQLIKRSPEEWSYA
ncbi:unnamed protein product [Caretta caretta]